MGLVRGRENTGTCAFCLFCAVLPVLRFRPPELKARGSNPLLGNQLERGFTADSHMAIILPKSVTWQQLGKLIHQTR